MRIYVNTYVPRHIWMCIYMSVCIQVRMYAHTYVYRHLNTHTYKHTCVHLEEGICICNYEHV